MSEYEIDFPNEVRPAEMLSSTERIRRNRSPEQMRIAETMARVGAAYLGSQLDKRIDEEMDLIFDAILAADDALELGSYASVGRKSEGRAFGVIGASGTGKSRAMKRTFTRRPELEGFGTPDCLLISTTAPSPCTPRLLGQRILDAAGYVSRRALKENEVWELLAHQLPLTDIRIVHIDEAQHITEMSEKGMVQKVRNSLKTLMASGCARHVILSGLPGCEALIDPDIQIDRRSRVLNLRLLDIRRDLERVEGAIRAFSSLADVDPSPILNENFLKKLCHAGMSRFGIVVEYVQDALRIAIMQQSTTLTTRHFARVFEARTGAQPCDNVFIMSTGWEDVDVAHARKVEKETRPATSAVAPANWRNDA